MIALYAQLSRGSVTATKCHRSLKVKSSHGPVEWHSRPGEVNLLFSLNGSAAAKKKKIERMLLLGCDEGTE